MADNSIHTPVLLERTLELLGPALEHDGAVLVELACSLPSKRASGSAIVRHQPAKDRLNKSRLTVRKLTPMPNMVTKSLHTIEKSAPRYAIPCMKLM